MILLLGFAFLAGFVTILAPCIWPLLPIVLSSAAAGKSHLRPLGITLGIMLSFTVFTLAISLLVSLFHLDPNLVRLFAVIVLVFLGLTMIIPALSHLTESLVSKLAGKFGTTGQSQGSDFGSGFITGLSLGVVWTPCSGPILASIATLAATGQVTFSVVLVTLAYVIGVGIPLFLFAYGGQRVIGKTRFMSSYTGKVQQVFGVLMLLTALAIYTNYDKVLQLKLLDAFPSYSSALTSFEKNSIVKKQLDQLKGKTNSISSEEAIDLFNVTAQKVPEFTGINQWLNLPDGAGKESKALTMAELKGKVVLVDFWTYTCINCIRTLPFVTSWFDKYHDQGFVVVGVHTPEFAFEKETYNVLDAIKRYKIHYPVAQDNDYATWNAYSNQYWPAEYLIDAKGMVRRVHFGEGEYDQMEKAIQLLLKENGSTVSSDLVTMPDSAPKGQISPETYLGSKRMLYMTSSGKTVNGTQTFPTVNKIEANHFAFAGDWDVMDEYSVSGKDAAISYNFYAGDVYLVMGPSAKQSSSVKVLLDGKIIDSSMAGKDVVNGVVTVDSQRLYELVNLQGKTESHVLTIQFKTLGTQAFAFTFGN